MSKKVSVSITKLDAGYLVKANGKSQAMENTKNLKEYLSNQFLTAIDRIDHATVKNMTIDFEIDENVPENLPR